MKQIKRRIEKIGLTDIKYLATEINLADGTIATVCVISDQGGAYTAFNQKPDIIFKIVDD